MIKNSGKGSAAVVGAGVFGSWTSLFLARAGYKVTLIDAFGPGNARASSGGETRVLRMGYGGHRRFFDMALRSREMWMAEQKKFSEPVYIETGCLWMLEDEGRLFKDSIPHFERARLPVEELSATAAKKSYPSINPDGVKSFFLERQAGYLKARRSCTHVVNLFIKEGGTFIKAQVLPVHGAGESLSRLKLSNGEKVEADFFVFACGPWLPQVLPGIIKNHIRPTRQEVFFFGLPPDHPELEELPVWINIGPGKFYYGIPQNESRGFKVADDNRGENFDPSQTDRVIDPAALKRARDFIGFRFPEMKGAPLTESRVCQYEDTPDRDFIMGSLKNSPRIWIAGGGSGHGFKHGPAIGEMMANAIAGRESLPTEFSPGRF